MLKTPPEKWHIGLLAAALWLTAPFVDLLFYRNRLSQNAYQTNADSIAIPLYYLTVAWAVATPIFILLAWLVVRLYRGGLSFWSFDAARPLRSATASIVWGGLALLFLYSAAETALLHNWIDTLSYLPWVYLFLCVRSSFSAPKTGEV